MPFPVSFFSPLSFFAPRPSRIGWLAITLLIAGLTVVACSDDDDPAPAAPTTDTAAEDEADDPGDADAGDDATPSGPIDPYGGDAGADDPDAAAPSTDSDTGDTAHLDASGNTALGRRIAETIVKILPSDADHNDEFGWSVAISGHTLVSGSPLDDDRGGSSGSLNILEWRDGGWQETVKLIADDGLEGDWFGKSVAIDGNTLITGANQDDDDRTGDEDTGSVYVYTRPDIDSDAWAFQAKLVAPQADAGDQFGFDVAIASDVIAVGAPKDDDAGFNAGAVYLFQRGEAGWIFSQKIVAADGEEGDGFGMDLALAGDLLAIGAHADDDLGEGSGSAYLYRRTDTGTWAEEAKLLPSDGIAWDEFGWDIDTDGVTVIVGSPFHDFRLDGSGAAYLYRADANGWQEIAKLTASDPWEGAWFGRAVTVAADGVAVGAPRIDRPADDLNAFGVTYLFHGDADGWRQTGRFEALDAASGDDFGWVVEMTQKMLTVGVWLDDTAAGADTGSVYTFMLDPNATHAE